MIFIALVMFIGLASGQILTDNSVNPMMAMPQITKLDVQCAKSGMTVDVEFDAPFNGIIFSKGHFSDPNCRYVGANSNLARFSFAVPMQGCGTQTSSSATTGLSSGARTVFSNIIIIQNDGIVQEIWDTARKLTCNWVDRITKTVSVRPLTINMLEAVEARFTAQDDVVDVWMDLQFGEWPQSSVINSPVRIGQTLSLIVGVRDQNSEMDSQVRDCYAHSTPNLSDSNGFQVQLTDSQGCVLKPKLLTPFVRERGTGPYQDSTVNVAFLSAFSFPDNMEVFTSCNVEVCKGSCQPSPCQTVHQESTLLPEAITTPRSQVYVTPETVATTTVRVKTQPPPPTPPTPRTTQPPPPPTIPVTLPPPPPTIPVTLPPPPPTTPVTLPPPPPTIPVTLPPPPPSTPRVTRPPPPPPTVYLPPVISPPDCSFGSKDRRCFVPTTPKTTQPPVTNRCRSGSLDPKCNPRPPPPPPPVCTPESTDPRCPQPTSPPVVVIFRTTTAAPLPPPPPPTVPACYPGSSDPLCQPPPPPPPPTVPACYPGSPDPLCQPRPPPTVPTCYLGSPDPLCQPPPPPPPPPTTTTSTTNPPPVLKCFPGSTLPECIVPIPSTSRPNPPGYPRVVPKPPLCLPGSNEPECLIPGGSNQFPVTERPLQPTTSRLLPPVLPREKINPPSGEGWKGDPATHAFHMFHFQRGDGRRNRLLPSAKTRRSTDSFNDNEVAQVRLTRSVRVIPAEQSNPLTQNELLVDRDDNTNGNPSTFCLSTFSLVAGVTFTSISLISLALGLTLLAFKYFKLKSRLPKKVAAY